MCFEACLEDQPQNPRPWNPPRSALLLLPRLHPPHFSVRHPLLWVVTMGVDGVLSPQIPTSVLSHFEKSG